MKAGVRSAGRFGFLGAVLAVLLVCPATYGGEAQARPRVLLSAAQGGATVERGRRPTEMRKRRVNIDFSALAGADEPEGAGSVSLNLFPDFDITAVKTRFARHGGQRFAWFGKVQDDPLSMVVLTSEDGLMNGLVFAHGRHFSIQGASASTQEVAEVDQSAFPPEGCDQIPAGDPAPTEAQPTAASGILADSGASIDVLVVYTPAARVDAGGTAAIQLLAQQSVNVTNASYTNSGIVTQLNLVHAAEVAYFESPDTPAGWDQDLNRLAGNGDGSLDGVHALRELYGADVVLLLVRDSVVYCGLADAVMANAATAFALVAQGCATFDYTFGHEVGHLQGARHDMFVDDVLGEPYDYNHGHVNTAIRQRTVMAYNTLCAETPPGTYCVRVPYWSNPGVSYPSSSAPTGTVARANNALVLNTTAATVANFRQERFALTIQSTNPAAGVTIAVSPADVSGLAAGSTTFVRTYGSGSTVTLTAPSLGGGNPFGSWTGCTATSGPSGEVCTVTIASDRTVTANYARSLTVMSAYPAVGVPITVSPTDVGGLGSGDTQFVRSYTLGTIVTLTAPLVNSDCNNFAGWTGCNGTSGGVGEICSVTMSTDKTVVATYAGVALTVASTYPASGVPITVDLADICDLADGMTTFTRNYASGAIVTLTAPSVNGDGNNFAGWTGCNGTSGGLGEVCSVTMSTDKAVVAGYTRVAPTSFTLWSRSSTGQAAVLEIDTATNALQNHFWLYSPQGVGAPWQATSYTRVDDTTAYILWSRSDFGKASLWKINPAAATGYPPVVPYGSQAFLYSTAGVGPPWQATSFEYVSPTEGYVLWGRSDSGKASLWRINPGALATPGLRPPLAIDSNAFLYSTAGVGTPWLATSFNYVSPGQGFVYWTKGTTGKSVIWQINPSSVGGTLPIPIDVQSTFSYPAELGSSFEAHSYVR